MSIGKVAGALGGIFTGFVNGAQMHSQCPAYDSLARTMLACADGDTARLAAYLIGGALIGTAVGAAVDVAIYRIKNPNNLDNIPNIENPDYK